MSESAGQPVTVIVPKKCGRPKAERKSAPLHCSLPPELKQRGMAAGINFSYELATAVRARLASFNVDVSDIPVVQPPVPKIPEEPEEVFTPEDEWNVSDLAMAVPPTGAMGVRYHG